MNSIEERIAKELEIKLSQVQNVIGLLDDGNTVPFISRYRKEATGGLSDEVLRKLSERLTYLRNLEERKADVTRLIKEQEKYTDEIGKALESATTLTEVEDIYRPFKPKKRTKATIAVEKGLKPLAELILEGKFSGDLDEEAAKYISEEKGVTNSQEAIQGALDIIAESISDEAKYRKYIREFVIREGNIESKGSSDEPTPYEMYYEYSEAVNKIPPHRILAINRGEKEKILNVKITVNEDKIIQYLENQVLKGNETLDEKLKLAIRDSLKRLIYPSIEREIRSELTDIGEEGAIKIFKENLKALLLQAPIKGKVVMGYDPGFRTGCKIAILDATGKFLENTAVYPTVPKRDIEGTKKTLKALIAKHNVDVISLGNGTASRESEEVIAEMITEIKNETGKELAYVIVSEAGASVYSASELATKEYPDLDVTVRGAISIGRRLQDPLAELVKIDPKAIGVGQYQHDVTPKKLEESLAGVVEDSVNTVGVDLNIATPSLLTHISGINASIAKNIVDYREEVGRFTSRKELLKVKRLGQKAYEQCAGFLRVDDSKEPLDNTSVHPESYDIAKKLIEILGYNKEDLKNNKLGDIDERAQSQGLKKLSETLEVGEMTLKDIIKELKKPGRDPREEMPKPILKTGIIELKDLKPGMVLAGTVRNVSDFGAFVDIGVHQDGLVHKSQMANRFVKHPLDIVKVGDIVKVAILEVDEKRKRISLTMKDIDESAEV
ncbi:Tex family protein [Clostridium beijerinckii]|uniref:RNA-binding transcriptional accessory protein n=1 Tax=Clostridium beijerinckii TaxID=1520 RepID=A0A7X9STF1_CLOBE|nr:MULTISPECIES: Tex family protein [Clostridium]MBN7574713.1 RNA-binding transcriptional accessory protein [Clostridium beijerinckii]MBN7579963.1 RNA-binding transcriptional accessory protein [Clostridium beijerinckii]MBN7584478.1 RNA-binding transcriptional accessory protein [Clostridium beijerinckii]MBO0522358.1 RNA-binding transcriptional accessory protein [Clostridium beijerinckii]NMF07483.1 RNA-binding transcriptional accessory protein [Clostridium beijerinckii]